MSTTTTTLTFAFGNRPLLWVTAIVAIAAYWDPKALRGNFVYDDVASVINNDVVMAKVPWHEAFTRDFWGKQMAHPASHKSYRPITSLTLRLNMVMSLMDETAGGPDHTYYFHLVNVLLHGINTGLITETAAMVLNCGLNDDEENRSGVKIAGPLIAKNTAISFCSSVYSSGCTMNSSSNGVGVVNDRSGELSP